MVKLNVSVLRYLSSEDFRVLTAVRTQNLHNFIYVLFIINYFEFTPGKSSFQWP